MSRRLLFFIVLVTSAVTLELQLLQIRILSVALWYHFVYIVITMALLGFATSGTVLFLSNKLKNLSDESFYAFCLIGLSISVFISSKYGYYPIIDTFALSPNPKIIFGLMATYLILMLPYFFAGLAIGGSFMRFPGITAKIYFFNLIGSSLGCLFFIVSIGPIGASHLVTITSLLSIAPLLYINLQHKLHKHKRAILIWPIFLILILAFPEDSIFHNILPEKHKQFWTVFQEDTEVEYTKWNPISRIDVISYKKAPGFKYIVMDGDAMAWFYSPALSRDLLRTTFVDRNAAYVLADVAPERVLVIGAGGGFDVLTAVFNSAKIVDAVEINPTTAYLIREKFSDQINNVFSYNNINLFVEDGRSFVRRSPYKYDAIILYYTDSFLALSTGAYTLSDSFLYTKEAFIDYLDHLTDTGYIQIGRWAYPEKPKEALRVFSIALAACREKGYKRPSEHIVVIASQNKTVGNVIFKTKPFSRAEKEKLIQFCKSNRLEIWYPDIAVVSEGQRNYMEPFVSLAKYSDSNTESEFYNKYEFDVTPSTDDIPFFYHYNRKGPLQIKPSAPWTSAYFNSIRGVWHIFVLSFLFLHASVLSLILVLLPLMFTRKRASISNLGLFTCFYFFSIGFAFMLLEMGILQKFVLFLGSPIYSMAVVIPAILAGAGFGSLSSGLIKKHLKQWIMALVFICGIFILILVKLMPFLSNLFLLSSLWFRIGIVTMVVAPISYFMGFAFPLGLRLISTKDGSLVPWAWAINGSASVIASIAAIMIAMSFGFNLVLIGSACFYFIALLSIFTYRQE
ncbi:MAG: hypothetical protein Q8N80_02640 [Candidatus Omnitrophota bacterium]|nr:hypothetical protein [Candidatus Omnitrophota bacterium]